MTDLKKLFDEAVAEETKLQDDKPAPAESTTKRRRMSGRTALKVSEKRGR